jgi:hypothetical protein
MDSGTGIIMPELASFINRRGKVRLLFGDDFKLSESAALQKLFDLGVEIRLFTGEMNYHPKIWLFQGAKEAVSIIGSSNLSKSALMSNIEANVLIDDPKFCETLQKSFACLWDNYGLEINQEWIDHYRDREEVARSEPKYTRNGKPDFDSNMKQIEVFIRTWWKYIKQPKKRGQSEYWRGWYIAPEPAGFDDVQLAELQNVLKEIRDSDEYRKNGQVTITQRFANILITRAGVLFEGRPMTQSAQGRRDIFIRQHKNKLEKLGLLCTVDHRGPVIAITPLGERFSKSATKKERKRVYSKAAHNFRWAWAPKLDMVDFIERLLRSVPTNRLYFHELSYIVIHVFHPKMFGSTRQLVMMFKQLPPKIKDNLIKRTDRALENELRVMGKQALYHYQNKVFELMQSFGYVEGIRFHGVPKRYQECYLELT